jgi:hypothetical protein
MNKHYKSAGLSLNFKKQSFLYFDLEISVINAKKTEEFVFKVL